MKLMLDWQSKLETYQSIISCKNFTHKETRDVIWNFQPTIYFLLFYTLIITRTSCQPCQGYCTTIPLNPWMNAWIIKNRGGEASSVGCISKRHLGEEAPIGSLHG
ncbi:hypothetical protein AG4045_016141 [Apium graveolens]|uniref:Uncharacterized protein n=1 Tax=Apium graveolens TaxID=4045 RepID=A0A6L5B8K2_APIGR|nr:hypothetical protein AG4045_016141 [Apium graveolens]